MKGVTTESAPSESLSKLPDDIVPTENELTSTLLNTISSVTLAEPTEVPTSDQGNAFDHLQSEKVNSKKDEAHDDEVWDSVVKENVATSEGEKVVMEEELEKIKEVEAELAKIEEESEL